MAKTPAKPAAKAAPAKKAAAPAAKSAPAKKAAQAPAPEETEEDGVEIGIGTQIVFAGYPDDVPAEEQVLTAGEVYEVVGFTEPEGDDPGGDILVEVDNPDFNSKKKETTDNPKTVQVAVLEGEYELAEEGDDSDAEEGEEAEEAAEEEAEVEEAPAPKAKGKTAKAEAKAETAPAKKTTKAVKAAPVTPVDAEEGAEEDDMPELEGEDEEVLALVNGSEDLIATAQQLEQAVGRNEFQLGGILFHIKKDKTYLTAENGEELYGSEVKGGFAKFLQDYFNIEYRKAMYLIDIYVALTVAKIENPGEVVANMGWSKAAKIARPMMEDPAKADDLIALANESTVKDLSEAIAEQVEVGGGRTPGVKVTKMTLKFKFSEEEGKSLATILEAAQQQHGLKDIGAALSMIVNDWASTNGVGEAETTKAAAPSQKKVVGKPAAKAAGKKVAAKA